MKNIIKLSPDDYRKRLAPKTPFTRKPIVTKEKVTWINPAEECDTYLHDEVIALGGTTERKEDSVAVVSIWFIPGGDYTNAVCFYFFFNDLEKANEFERKNSCPPECPILLDLTKEPANLLFPIKS